MTESNCEWIQNNLQKQQTQSNYMFLLKNLYDIIVRNYCNIQQTSKSNLKKNSNSNQSQIDLEYQWLVFVPASNASFELYLPPQLMDYLLDHKSKMLGDMCLNSKLLLESSSQMRKEIQMMLSTTTVSGNAEKLEILQTKYKLQINSLGYLFSIISHLIHWSILQEESLDNSNSPFRRLLRIFAMAIEGNNKQFNNKNNQDDEYILKSQLNIVFEYFRTQLIGVEDQCVGLLLLHLLVSLTRGLTKSAIVSDLIYHSMTTVYARSDTTSLQKKAIYVVAANQAVRLQYIIFSKILQNDFANYYVKHCISLILECATTRNQQNHYLILFLEYLDCFTLTNLPSNFTFSNDLKKLKAASLTNDTFSTVNPILDFCFRLTSLLF